jgi:hypothetical protein
MVDNKQILQAMLALTKRVEKQAKKIDSMNNLLITASFTIVELQGENNIRDAKIQNLWKRVKELEGN